MFDWHCREVPSVARAGAVANPDVTFHTDDACLAATYDLVVASSSLHYEPDWASLLRRLAGASADYLLVTRVPVALEAPSFVVVQHAGAYGYCHGVPRVGHLACGTPRRGGRDGAATRARAPPRCLALRRRRTGGSDRPSRLPVPSGGAGRLRAGHRPYNRAMNVYADVLRYRELFGSLFRRDLRAKYKGSVLGLAWTLALPITLMLVYLVVFAVLWKAQPSETEDYWLFLLCGLPPWVFFATSLQGGSRSLVENAPIIRKVRFPRQLVPLSVVATEVVAFAAMTAIVLVLALWFRADSRDLAWVAIPVAAVIVVFVAGLALAAASLNAVFRDIEFVIAAALLPWFFLTPVLYRLDDLPGAESRPWLIDLLHWGNPVTPAIEAYRAPLYAGELPRLADALYLCIAAAVALVVGAFVFSRVDDRIASEA